MPKWTQEEEAILKLHYETKTLKEIGLMIGKEVKTVNKKARQMNLNRKNARWTPEEVEQLKQCKDLNGAQIGRMFPEHSYDSVLLQMKKAGMR